MKRMTTILMTSTLVTSLTAVLLSLTMYSRPQQRTLLLQILIVLSMAGLVLFASFGYRHGRLVTVMGEGWHAPEKVKQKPCTFSDVAANEQALHSLAELRDYLKCPDKYVRYGARIPRGVLLYGPPGTGKTLLARALAGEADVPFFALSGSDFVEKYVGVGASRGLRRAGPDAERAVE